MLVLAVFGFLLVFGLWFAAWSLGMAGTVVQVPKVSFSRRLLAVLVLTVIDILVLFMASRSESRELHVFLLWQLIFLALMLVAVWITVVVTLRTSWSWGLLVLLVWSVFQITFSTGAVLGLKAYVLEAYIIPTNNMAPTLAGPHVRGTCPHCGKPALLPAHMDPFTGVYSVSHHRQDDEKLPVVQGICFSCLRIGKMPPNNDPIEPWDRILVNKLRKPQRWDLLVFRYPKAVPGEPPPIYVVRLVGMPGEQVQIKHGAVWINGVRQTMPEWLQGLQYTSGPHVEDDLSFEEAIAKDEGREPFQLSAKGYFVLGDFITLSSDSRDWGEVPGENIIGVASVIYWPRDRWRVLP